MRCLPAGHPGTQLLHDQLSWAEEGLAGASQLCCSDWIETTVARLLELRFAGKLKLNPTKTKLTTVGRKVKILGMVILPSGQVALDMDLKRRIEVLLHFYVRNRERFLKLVDNDMKSGIEQLSGYINHVNAVDQAYLEKLSKKYGSTVVDSFLHRPAK